MNKKNFTIRPQKGLTLRDPETNQVLPEQGQVMPRNGFWLRRLKDGDVVECTAKEVVKADPKEKEKGK